MGVAEWLAAGRYLQTYAEGMHYIEGFIDRMEGTCASTNCKTPVEWEVAASTLCCNSTDTYCRSCARAQWYQSGLSGRRCEEHNILSQIIYHPRKIGGSGKCVLCPGACPVWDGATP